MKNIPQNLKSKSQYSNGLQSLLTAVFLFSVFYCAAQTKTVCPTGCDYASLTNTGGAFDAINATTLTANMNLEIAGDLTAETGTIALNAVAVPYTVRIYPTGIARTISGTGSAKGLVILNGADRITIDGSLNAAGTDKSLAIKNAATSFSGTITLLSLGDGAGANYNTIKNCLISHTTKVGYGIYMGSYSSFLIAGSDNDNNTIQNNTIFRTQQGIAVSGTAAGTTDNLIISGNIIGSTVSGDEIKQTGIQTSNVTGMIISNNTVKNIVLPSGIANDMWGMAVGAANSTITNNTVSGINFTGTSGSPTGYGIAITGSGNILSNNAVSDIKGGLNAVGISTSGTGNKFYYNSVNLNSGSTPSKALLISSGSGFDIRNNIFAVSSSLAAAYAIYSNVANTAFSNLNYNDYYVSGTQGILGFIGSNRTNLTDIVTGFGQNANSVSIAPAFITATDLHLSANSALEDMGTPIAEVLTDIDADTRSVIAPDMGIDEHYIPELIKTVCASGCNYTSLTNTGGAFSAINGMTLTNSIALQIAGDLTAETGANMLNAFAAPHQVRLYPTGAARIISGTATGNDALIGLYGADRVIIDGSLNGTGTDKSLSITATASANACIGLFSLADGAGASNNTIRNCLISNTSKTGYGICLCGATLSSSNGSDNDNNTIQNNTIFRVQQGITTRTSLSAVTDNLTITGNTFGSYVTGDEISQTAMFVSRSAGLVISANTIQNIIMDHGIANEIWGISVSAATAVISANTIKGVAFTTNFSYPVSGMAIYGTDITISNNAISNIGGGSAAYGIRVGGSATSGINLYYNSVNLYTATPSKALFISDGSNLDIRNNIFSAASNSAPAYAIYSDKANTAFTAINYNDYYVSGTQGILGFLASNRTDLAGIVSGFGQNANAVDIAPVFASATDLHLPSASNALANLGVPIAAVTTDFDGQTRSTATPDMGMDEFDCSVPAGFTYASTTASYYARFTIASNSPSFTTNTASSFSVSPALPAGLSLDTTTGVISGTPTAVSAAANYTVTASNACGSVAKVLNISIISSASSGDNGLAFDGTDDYVSMPAQSTSVTGNFTVEAWVKPTDATKIMHVFSSRTGADLSFDIQLRYGTQIHGDIGNGSGWLTTAADAAFNYAVNTWLHIAYVVTPAGYKIYANGNQVGSGTFTGTPMLFNSSRYLTLGKSAAETTLFKGSMDDVRIYNTALTQPQVLEDAKGNYLAAGLVAYYSFDEGISGGTNTIINKLFEQTESGTLHGMLNNFALAGSTSNWADGQAIQSQSITFSAIGNKTFGSGSFTLAATASSGLAVSYSSSNPAVVTISGNTAAITGIGTATITATQSGNLFYNAAGAVTQVLTVTAPVVSLKLFIQGYYTGSGMMAPVRNNQDYVSGMAEVEEVTVELHHPTTYAVVAATTATLLTNGMVSCAFPTGPNGSFYIAVKGRNMIQTWSAVPQVVGNAPLNYDFTGSAAKAYGGNLKQVEPGVWAIYSGDTNGDDIIDPTDYAQWESDFNSFSFGVFATDLNGDGIVDPSDYAIWEQNFNSFIYADYPF
jgi:hypothetical protein